MNRRAMLLHAHVVSPTKDLAICRDEACSNRHAALAGAELGLFDRRLETDVGG